MKPYTTLTYFLILGVVLLPMIIAGARGKANGRWLVGATALLLLVQYYKPLQLTKDFAIPEIVPLAVYAVYQWLVLKLVLRTKGKSRSWWAVPLGLLPLAVAKYAPLVIPDARFGFAGISYVTFRVLDVLWMVTDGVLAQVGLLDYGIFVFFFPTISSGPIDRFRRFQTEWRRQRTAAEFWQDLDAGVSHLFRGLLYTFIIATLLKIKLDLVQGHHGIHGAIEYGYVYSLYLFFDFAGYSAFAVGVSRCFGVKSPENFNLPFAAANIRDFWNRWHISLSTWFRDHVYTRFLLMAVKRKWFRKREWAATAGYFVSFGLMGVWHGTAPHYIIYGLYHATLMSAYDAFARWKKKHPNRFTSKTWLWTARVITFHFVCLGLWIFSGHGIQVKQPPAQQDPDKKAAMEMGPRSGALFQGQPGSAAVPGRLRAASSRTT